MRDDAPLGATGPTADDDALGTGGPTAAQGAGHAGQSERPPGGAVWVSPLVQRPAKLRREGVYELIFFVYAYGRRGLAIRNAKKPYRLESL